MPVDTQGLSGKVALVTGGGSGIGRSIAETMVKAGAAVVVVDLDGAKAEETAARIRQTNGRAVGLRTDVTQAADVVQAVEACIEAFGRLDVLVNNAGILGRPGRVIDTSEEEWTALFDVNVKGAFLVTKHAIPHIRQGGGGAIVNVASTAGLAGSSLLGAYAASKGALVLLTRSLALDHAHEGIRVNCVCPGPIETPMLDRFFSATTDAQARAALRQTWLARTPLGRFGRSDEVARVVLFLASDDASHVTGIALPVDGGRLA